MCDRYVGLQNPILSHGTHWMMFGLIVITKFEQWRSVFFCCCFYVKIVEKNADPEEMLLAYLRRKGMVISIRQCCKKEWCRSLVYFLDILKFNIFIIFKIFLYLSYAQPLMKKKYGRKNYISMILCSLARNFAFAFACKAFASNTKALNHIFFKIFSYSIFISHHHVPLEAP